MVKAAINQIKSFPWHPYLLAVFPTLALLSYKIAEIMMAEAVRSLLVSLAAAILLTLALRLLVKDFQRAAVISSLVLVLFFSDLRSSRNIHKSIENGSGNMFFLHPISQWINGQGFAVGTTFTRLSSRRPSVKLPVVQSRRQPDVQPPVSSERGFLV